MTYIVAASDRGASHDVVFRCSVRHLQEPSTYCGESRLNRYRPCASSTSDQVSLFVASARPHSRGIATTNQRVYPSRHALPLGVTVDHSIQLRSELTAPVEGSSTCHEPRMTDPCATASPIDRSHIASLNQTSLSLVSARVRSLQGSIRPSFFMSPNVSQTSMTTPSAALKRAYIALGSNMGGRAQNIHQALKCIASDGLGELPYE